MGQGFIGDGCSWVEVWILYRKEMYSKAGDENFIPGEFFELFSAFKEVGK